MDKKPLIGVFLCIILLFCILIPICQSKKIDQEKKTISTSDDGDIYFFTFAFVIGRYDNCYKWFNHYRIWNPDYSKKTISVLGYSPYYSQKFIFVKAFNVEGCYRIGFIGRHHCMIFTFGVGLTVDT